MTVSIDLTQAQLDSIAAQQVPPVVTPPPPVVVPPTVVSSKVVQRPQALIVCIETNDGEGHTIYPGASDGGRYDRKQFVLEVSGPNLRIGGRTEAVILSPGKIGPLPIPVQIDATLVFTDAAGVVRFGPTKTFNAGSTLIMFDVPGDSIPEGWHMVTVRGLPPGWGVFDYPIYNRRSGLAAAQSFMPITTSSHHHALDPVARWQSAWVPAKLDPTVLPLPPREYPDVALGDRLYVEMLSPVRPEDMYRTNRTPTGIMSTANRENYNFSAVRALEPMWTLLDGPRGRGNVATPLGLRESRRPDSPKVYFVESWRYAVLDRSAGGTIKTLAGFVHDEPPAYTVAAERYTQHYTTRQKPRLVGDWSRVTVKGFREPWDIAFWNRSLGLDPTAPLIGGESPHQVDSAWGITGPRTFIPDTGNNRVLQIDASPTDRLQPVVVTEFASGINEPWNCEELDDVLYVTAKLGNELLAFDIPTKRLLWRKPIFNPSGLRILDGEFYLGRMTGPGAGTIDKATLSKDPAAIVFKQHCIVPMDGNSNFVNLAVSDGTFMARGSTAAVTWSNANYGRPWCFDPAGVRVDPFKNAILATTSTGQYGTCVSIAHGRMTFGTMLEGLNRASKALPTDSPTPALFAQGAKEYADAGYVLTHGDGGFGYYGLPLPWGKSAAIDAYLQFFGHKP